MSTRKKLIIFIISLLVIDQVVKIWIKTHMMIGDEFSVFGDWFKIHFIENNGMAFGMELGGGKWGKTVLSVFRLIAVVGIAWYLGRLIKEKAPMGVILSFGLIFCGAVGNIIDSVFYGVLFNESTHSQIASFLPEGGGYAPLFYGKVVDMFYFPIIDTNWPQWMPLVGGDHFIFFSPIFNLADAAISCGIIALLLFYSKYLNDSYHAIKKS